MSPGFVGRHVFGRCHRRVVTRFMNLRVCLVVLRLSVRLVHVVLRGGNIVVTEEIRNRSLFRHSYLSVLLATKIQKSALTLRATSLRTMLLTFIDLGAGLTPSTCHCELAYLQQGCSCGTGREGGGERCLAHEANEANGPLRLPRYNRQLRRHPSCAVQTQTLRSRACLLHRFSLASVS